jgi:hypothetical protein
MMSYMVASANRHVSLLLRLGLAFVFGYAAFSQLTRPFIWTGYMPDFIFDFVEPRMAVTAVAISHIVLGIWLLSGKYLHFASLTCAALLAGITLVNLGQLTVMFRDVGLVFAAVALALMEWPTSRQRPKNDSA